jgi:predicted MFS family arabinose efflux permease
MGPLLFGADLHWPLWLWPVMTAGVAIIAGFVRLEQVVARRGGMPLIDLSLLDDRAFMRGLCAVFWFFFANLSFYLVMTIHMQRALQIPPLQGGMVFVPLALTFVVASRHAASRARHRGTWVLIEGCALQIAGLAALAICTVMLPMPGVSMLAMLLMIFGYGQGFVMAPLSSAVLATVKPASAGSGSGIYGTVAQIANAAGVAVIGAIYFATESVQQGRVAFMLSLALFAISIVTSAVFLSSMRRASASS